VYDASDPRLKQLHYLLISNTGGHDQDFSFKPFLLGCNHEIQRSADATRSKKGSFSSSHSDPLLAECTSGTCRSG